MNETLFFYRKNPVYLHNYFKHSPFFEYKNCVMNQNLAI